VRTSVSLITFGFSIYQFFRIARRDDLEGKYLVGPREFGIMMILVGLVSLVIATWEHRRAMRELCAQYPDLHHSPERVIAFLVAALGLVGVLVALFRQ
ncbi:MAG: DUF202 domain-containing protein, partial [Verrucomicrobiaceae bacterium]